MNLPLAINSKTGILEFDIDDFKIEDFLKLIETNDFSLSHFDMQHPFENHVGYVNILLKVQALDKQTNQSSNTNLYAKVNTKGLVDRLKFELFSKNDTLKKLSYGIQLNNFQNNELELDVHDADTNTYNLILKESIPHNTVLMRLITYINKKPIKNMHEDCELVSNSSSKNDIDLYLKYDSIDGSIKLIRQVFFNNLKFLNFSILCYFHHYSNLTEKILTQHQIDVNVKIKNSNDNVPEIELSEQEIKNGKNLILVSIGDLNQNHLVEKLSVVSSSTPVPMHDPRPAIPELNLESAPSDFPRPEYLYDELNGNKLNLNEFNKQLIIRACRLLNVDDEIISEQGGMKVKFLPNATSQYVIDKFYVSTNGSHLIFAKKNTSLEGNLFENVLK